MYEELYHFGIKGQKWGVRRYQNPDGTLTNAGRQRYSSLGQTIKFGATLGMAKAEHYGSLAMKNVRRAVYAPQNKKRVQEYLNERAHVETRLSELETEHQNKLRQGQYYLDRAAAKVKGASIRDSRSRQVRDTNMTSRYNRNMDSWEYTIDRYGSSGSSWTQTFPTRAQAAKGFARDAGMGSNVLPKSIGYMPFEALAASSGYRETVDAGREYASALASYERELKTPSWSRYYD